MESAEPDLKSSQVTVKGALDPAKLVDYLYKRTGKQAVIVKQDSDKKDKEKEGDENVKKEEKKSEEEGDKAKSGSGGGGEANNPEENKKESGGESENKENVVSEENKGLEMKRNEYNYYPSRYAMELYAYNVSASQIFSDENPNACSVM